MIKRIVITGAECTGKSTLAQTLSGYYGEPWTPEFVRTYVQQVQRELRTGDLPNIFAGQLATEDAALGRAKRCILHDTNLLSTLLYAKHYFGRRDDAEEAKFLSRDYALYLLCLPDGVKWTEDPGQREGPEARDALQATFRESLKKMDLPYLELSGDLSTRVNEAVQLIDQLI